MHRKAGFSLIELMCAILILGVGLVGLSHGITSALSSSKETELQTSAALLAAGRIETLRSEPFIEAGETSGDFGEDLPNFQWKQSVSSTRIDGLFEVDVSIEKSTTSEVVYDLRTMLFDVPISSTETGKGSKGDNHDRRKRRSRQ